MKAADYPDAARAAIRPMHAQVDPLVFDADRQARRGLLIHHLVTPGCLDETRAILEWIASTLGSDTYVNLMDQYFPAGKMGESACPEITRKHETLRWHRRLTMPVYEFACRDCQRTFEIIRPMSESSSANVTCTHCGSTKVERVWSTVYAVTSKKS